MRRALLLLVLLLVPLMPPSAGAASDPLTAEERAFLASHGPLVVVANDGFAPFAYFNPSGELRGINEDFLSLMSVRLGLEFRVMRTTTFDETLAALANRSADLTGNLAETPARRETLTFSEPYAWITVGLWTKGGRALDPDLAGVRVAAVANTAATATLLAQHPGVVVQTVVSVEEGLARVERGEADAFIGSNAANAYAAIQAGYADLQPSGRVIEERAFSWAARRDEPIVGAILAKGLATVSREERSAIFTKWTGTDLSPPGVRPPLSALERNVLLGIGGVALVAAAWGATLHVRVRQVTRRLREREAQQRLLVEGAPEYAFFTLDRGGLVASWNQGAARLFGRSEADALGKPFALLRPRAPDATEARHDAEVAASAEGQCERPDGSTFWAETVVSPVQDHDRLTGFVVMTRDATRRKESEALFRNLIEAAPDAMIVSDAQGRIVLANDEAIREFGYERAQLHALRVEELLPALADAEERVEGAQRRNLGARGDVQARRRDGTRFEAEVSLSPLPLGGSSLIIAAIRNISARLALEREARGQLVTRSLVQRLMRELGARRVLTFESRRALGRGLARKDADGSVEEAVRDFARMGMGELAIESREDGRFTFMGRSLLELDAGSRVPTCGLALGYLEGVVAKHTESRALGTEVSCQSTGHDACRFVVMAREAGVAAPRRRQTADQREAGVLGFEPRSKAPEASSLSELAYTPVG